MSTPLGFFVQSVLKPAVTTFVPGASVLFTAVDTFYNLKNAAFYAVPGLVGALGAGYLYRNVSVPGFSLDYQHLESLASGYAGKTRLGGLLGLKRKNPKEYASTLQMLIEEAAKKGSGMSLEQLRAMDGQARFWLKAIFLSITTFYLHSKGSAVVKDEQIQGVNIPVLQNVILGLSAMMLEVLNSKKHSEIDNVRYKAYCLLEGLGCVEVMSHLLSQSGMGPYSLAVAGGRKLLEW